MPPALMVRGLRGATTVDADTVDQVTGRSQELMREIMTRNELVEDDIVERVVHDHRGRHEHLPGHRHP